MAETLRRINEVLEEAFFTLLAIFGIVALIAIMAEVGRRSLAVLYG
jgi:hypothetical protein